MAWPTEFAPTATRESLSERRPLGATGLEVTPICVGSGPLGGASVAFDYDTPVDQAVTTVLAAFASPFNFLDTSAGYSNGEAERRIGLAIREAGGLPDGFVLGTKVDPDPVTGAFDGPAVRRSFESSLERLGVDWVPLLQLHDPEVIGFEAGVAPGGAVEELIKIRDEGLVGHLGVAGGALGVLAPYVATGVFEVLLTHNRWTLADRTARRLIDDAVSRGMGVINGAPFGGGVLARGAGASDKYCYSPINPSTRRTIESIEAICAAAGVPLGAAALQFSLRATQINATVVGVTKPERIEQTVAWATWEIPDDAWDAILAAAGESAGLPD
ncbi:MAG: aldo/keto reductase [Bifidobacteriaceae bacterium]|jgi:D-threo-aldose 1-dehydrogenase|nr:aldo/keto reductase [Bifidobacteriaceae bacterium]